VPNTNIFSVSVSWDSPRDAERLAQGIAELFISENLRRQQGEPGGSPRLADLEEAARSYESHLEPLRQQRDRLDQAVTAGDLGKLAELNNLETRITALDTSRANLLVEINRARSSLDTASILDRASAARVVAPLSTSQALLIGLLLGTAAADVLALFLEQVSDLVRLPDDVEGVTGNGPLVTVGRVGTG